MKEPASSVKLFTAIMVGVALFFSACNCLENYLLHPGSSKSTVDICIKFEEYTPVADPDALIVAFKKYPPTLYNVRIRKKKGGPDDFKGGTSTDDCCEPPKKNKPDGYHASSTTVTQVAKHQSSAAKSATDDTFKEIVRLLKKPVSSEQ
jgi:hypothetical protein